MNKKTVKIRINEHLKSWAEKNSIKCYPESDKVVAYYTYHLKDNLFQPLEQNVFEDYNKGAGKELDKKMRALHSSSALAVNLFQYWLKNPYFIASILNRSFFDKNEYLIIKFENKLHVKGVKGTAPHIDVTIENPEENKIMAIEVKFTELLNKPKSLKTSPLSQQYNKLLNNFLPNVNEFLKEINEKKLDFYFFDYLQFIKHILGLLSKTSKEKFLLIYLYFELPDIFEKVHLKEIELFHNYLKKDNINFSFLTIQNLIKQIESYCDNSDLDYVNYIKDRYYFFVTT